MLQFWFHFPEVENLTFDGTVEYDDNGFFLSHVSLTDISFTSTQAQHSLWARLTQGGGEGSGSPDLSAWEEHLFEGGLPDIEPALWCEKLVRPVQPDVEIIALNSQIRDAVLSAARELGGCP